MRTKNNGLSINGSSFDMNAASPFLQSALHNFMEVLTPPLTTITAITFDEVESVSGDPTPDDAITNQSFGTITFAYTGSDVDQAFDYSFDGITWYRVTDVEDNYNGVLENTSYSGVYGNVSAYYNEGLVQLFDVQIDQEPTVYIRAYGSSVDPIALPGEVVSQSQEISFDNVAPTAGGALSFFSVDQGTYDSIVNATTNQTSGTVVLSYSGSDLAAGEFFQYSTDIGSTWTTIAPENIDTANNLLTLNGITLTSGPTIYIRAVDSAGNVTPLTGSVKITYDGTPPSTMAGASFSSVSSDTDDIAPTDAVTNQSTATVVFAYTGSDPSVVERVLYSVNDGPWVSTNLTNTKSSNTITITGLDVTASPTIRVAVFDQAGNFSLRATQTITYDNVSPAGIITVTFDSVTEGGLDSEPDSVTNQSVSTVVFQYTGTLASGERFQYSLDESTWSEVTSSNASSITIESLDVSSSPTVYIRAIDAAGNPTITLASQLVTYDATAPSSPSSVVFDSVTSDTDDSVPADGVTNQETGDVVFDYSGSDLGPGERFQYSVDNGLSWNDIDPSDVDTDGNTITLLDLTLTGSPQVLIRAIDAAGNFTETLGSQAITYDITPPVAGAGMTFVSVSQDVLDTVNNAVTNDSSADLVFAYTGFDLSSGDRFQYSIDGLTWTDVPAGSVNSGTNRININGVDVTSSPTVYVRAIDAAGNPSGVLCTQTITYDNTPPSSVGSVGLDDLTQSVLDTNDNDTTNQTTVTVVFSYDGSDLASGEYLQFSRDGTNWTTISADSIDTTNNTITLTGQSVAAPSASYTIRAVDAAGNFETKGTVVVYVDVTAPTNATSVSFSSVSESLLDTSTDAVTNQTTASVVFSYSGDDLGSDERFQYSVDGGTTWSNVSSVDTGLNTLTINSLDVSGSPTITIRAIDESGNFTTSLGSQQITYDASAPTGGAGMTFTSVTEDSDDSAADAVTNQSTATVVFTYTGSDLGPNEKFEYSVDGGNTWLEVDSVNTTDNTLTINNLDVSGSPTITVRAIDPSGNTTSNLISQVITFDD